MNLSRHVQASTLTSASYYMASHSVEGSLACLISGVLIDTDHWLEYWHDCRFDFDIPAFFRFCYSGTHTRVYILFHSYELVAAMVLCAAFALVRVDIAGGI